MGKIVKKKVSPRQKMINLMYVVLMAMLALNVSSDVLKGFVLVDEKLTLSTENSARVNEEVYKRFEQQYQANPTKVKVWYDKAQEVRGMTDSLYTMLEDLKLSIVKKSDGKDADVRNIRNKEDLEAATQVMLAPGTGRGEELFDAIEGYRERIVAMLANGAQRELVASNLNTEVPMDARVMGKNWQEYMFESMPTAAAVTLLTKLQNDIRYAEGQVLHNLVTNIDVKDIRVNRLNAYVIPSSRTVVQGGKFSAQITSGIDVRLFELRSRLSSVSPNSAKLSGSDTIPIAPIRKSLRWLSVAISLHRLMLLSIELTLLYSDNVSRYLRCLISDGMSSSVLKKLRSRSRTRPTASGQGSELSVDFHRRTQSQRCMPSLDDIAPSTQHSILL
jgi:hypothetical protein